MNRILTITRWYWPEGSGGELATHLHLKQISTEENFQVKILIGTKNPKKISNVDFIRSKLIDVSNKPQLWFNLQLLARKEWFEDLLDWADVVYIPGICYPLIPISKKFGNNVVVHLHDYQPISYSSVIFRYSLRGSKIQSLKDNIKLELFENESPVKAFMSTIFSPINRLSRSWVSEADKILCVSNRQKEIIEKHMPEISQKLSVVYNPLPNKPNVDETKRGGPTIVYPGGDSFVKGFRVFLKASRKLAWNSDVKFILTKRYRPQNRNVIRKLNKKFGGLYQLVGNLSRSRILSLYSQCHALVLPSIWEEPLPFTVMEAMLLGTIPIASKIGGIPEMLNGSPAERFLFEPRDVDGLLEKINLLRNYTEDEIDKTAEKLRENAEKKFNPKHIQEKFLEILEGK